MRDRLVLVTGGAGFIGSNLVDALARENAVAILDDLSTGRRENVSHLLDGRGVDFVKGSVADEKLVNELSKGRDFIFHLAAIPSLQQCHDDPVGTAKVNVGGTLNVLTAAQKAGAKVIFSSSSSVYGNPVSLPITEEMSLDPVSTYGTMKLAGDRFCKNFMEMLGVPCVALRYFNVYGPRQDPKSQYAAAVPIFISQALSGKPLTIFGDGKQTRDFVYVEDVVEANILAAQSSKADGKAFNIGTGESVTINDLANEILGIAEGGNMVHGHPRPGDVDHSVADISLAKNILGYKPKVSLRDGLYKTLAHFKGNVQR